MIEGTDGPELWTAQRLAGLLGGSTRKWMLTTGIPVLVAAGVLRKVGGRHAGRRADIVAALLGPKAA
jgi:hypothetical protein